MGRRFQQSDGEDETKVDISPLIDCVFILLIFFIVTTTFVNEQGFAVETPMPSPPVETDEEPSTVVFQVDARGQVLHEGQVIGLSGVAAAIRDSKEGEESPVIVQAVGDASADLQIRVVDQCRLAGSREISIDHRSARN